MTTKIQKLEQQLISLQETLAAHGIGLPSVTGASDKDRADYIEHGSEQHMALLGLMYVEKDDEINYITRESNGKTYRLEDEVTAFMHFPDPPKIAGLVLGQKIRELETKPEVPQNTPPLWTPDLTLGEWQQRTYAGA